MTITINDWLFVPASHEYPDSARWELVAYWRDDDGQEWSTSVGTLTRPPEDGELDAHLRQYLVQAIEHHPHYPGCADVVP